MVKMTDQAPIHLWLRWQKNDDPETVHHHIRVAEQRGSVWWGQFTRGTRRMAEARVARIRKQLEEGEPSWVYFVKSGSPAMSADVWRARLLEITTDSSDVDDRMPDYYEPEDHYVYVRVTDFEHLPAGQIVTELRAELGLAPIETAFTAMTNVRFVHRVDSGIPTPAETPAPAQKQLDLAWLEKATLMDSNMLEEIVDALSAGEQVVLAGPPGTSKTWLARHLAQFFTGDVAHRWRLVQFHPSYGYESFIEGLRPVVVKGAVDFKVVPGTVLDLADSARAQPDDPFVVVMDEMNRANLPRVLGELLYLFEYRNDKVDLMYSKGFVLPRNLYFIGTMNTADRSTRSLDAALRRRFTVFECPPDPAIVARFYDEGLGVNAVANLVDGFVAMNAALEVGLDRHHTIGQSFFMREEMTPVALRRIWVRQLAPLIEEYFFDRPDDVEKFRVDAFWPGA